MTITIKKIRNASQSYGRGMDNYRQPARYGVFKDSQKVATIWTENQTYMGGGIWVMDPEDRSRGGYSHRLFKKVKARALAIDW